MLKIVNARCQSIEGIRSRINFSRSVLSRLPSCLWSAYKVQGLPGSTDSTLRLRNVASASGRHILHVRHRVCVSTVELWHHLRLTSILAQLVQRRLYWFGHATRHPKDELIRNPLLPTPTETLTTTLKESLEPLSGSSVVGCVR